MSEKPGKVLLEVLDWPENRRIDGGIMLQAREWLPKEIHLHPGVPVADLVELAEIAYKEEFGGDPPEILVPTEAEYGRKLEIVKAVRAAREVANESKHAPGEHEWKVKAWMADDASAKLECECGAHMWQPTRKGLVEPS